MVGFCGWYRIIIFQFWGEKKKEKTKQGVNFVNVVPNYVELVKRVGWVIPNTGKLQ